VTATTITALMTLVTLVMAPSSGDVVVTSPELTVRQYCKLNVEGAGLTAEGRARMNQLFVHPRPSTAPPQTYEIAVVRDFVVKRDSIQGKEVWLVADYTKLGSLDASLHFTKFEAARPNAPVRLRDDFALVKDPVTAMWKISNSEFRLRLGLEAAMRYVAAARDATHDSTIKATAERTLDTLLDLASHDRAEQTAAAQKTAYSVFKEFCKLDNDGGQLTPDGWRKIASLFVHPQPGPPRGGIVTIVDGCALSNAEITDDGKAGIMREVIALCVLHPDTGLLEQGDLPPGGIKQREDFSLVQTDAHTPHASPSWKIEGRVPEPSMTVEAAIRYVTELRDKTTNPGIRKNSERALAGLRRQLPASSR
jgi:hypothetical protein